MPSILLVEDDAPIALAEKRKLEELGYRVEIAGTEEEAVRIAAGLATGKGLIRLEGGAMAEPGGDLGELALADIIDFRTLNALMENFSALTGMTVAILDLKGTILVATGWQDICTKFHRLDPESARACTESDLFLADGVRPGEYVEYRCRNGMWDIVTPLHIEGRYVGNLYSGQFFYDDEAVNEAAFAERARLYGFEEPEYLAALRRVPRFSREKVSRLMDFLVGLTGFVSRLSISNLRLSRAMIELEDAEKALSASVGEKETLFRELQHRVKNSLGIVSSLLRLSQDGVRDEAALRAFREAIDRISCVSMVYEKLCESAGGDSVDLKRYLGDLIELLAATYVAKDGGLRIDARMDAMSCDPKRAVSLGLILNELLTNAIKYASRPAEAGEVRVRFSISGGRAELRVSDDGPGFPPGFEAARVKSLGLRIVSLMVERIGGSLEYSSAGGASAIVRFNC